MSRYFDQANGREIIIDRQSCRWLWDENYCLNEHSHYYYMDGENMVPDKCCSASGKCELYTPDYVKDGSMVDLTKELSDIAELVDQQGIVIRIQSGIIDDLFLLLMQHISAEEADHLPVVDKINTAAKIRKEIGEG